MGIPDYQTLMLPLLKHTADGREHRSQALSRRLPRISNLQTPSGGSSFLAAVRSCSIIAWAGLEHI